MDKDSNRAYSAAESESAASPDLNSKLFDHKPASNDPPEVIQPSIGDADEAHPGDERRTVFMTVFFLVFMVIYVGFCAYYRRGKSSRTVHDEEDRETRRRANQAVMDESQRTSERARESAEEQARMEQRKAAIKQVLMIREIVDDAAVDAQERKNSSSYWFWETKEVKSPGAIATDGGELPASSRPDSVRTAKNIKIKARPAKSITIKEEEEQELDEMLAMAGSIEDSPYREVDDRMKHIRDIESNSTEETVDSDETHSDAPTPEDAGAIKILDVDNPTSESGPASPCSTSLKRYADALNCGACSSHPTSPCSLSSPSLHNASTKKLHVLDHPTITLGEIKSDHAECQICLSQFQVGDMAAWKRHPSSKDEAGGPAEESSETDCIHVFHEECISRWLMVRDGCPICRRSYFLDDEPRPT